MTTPRIGIDVDDLRLAVKDALRRAAEMNFRTVEMAAAREIEPTGLSATGRRHLAQYVKRLGLVAGGRPPGRANRADSRNGR